ncbi:MAG: class I SAM-dependent methyltransferase [Alphaproteobacteria bacterium]
MWMDALDLQDFYQTSLGLWVRRLLRSHLRAFVTPSPRQTVLGIGYPLPYLKLFSEIDATLAVLMPAQQGVLRWPPLEPSVSVLAEETAFPFPDACFDVVVCVHALEFSEQTHQMLRETWRVLKESGRLIVIAPHRRSIWSRVERTPFGHGHPYTQSQLSSLLRRNIFMPVRFDGALYIPPTRSRLVLASSPAWEKMGEKWFSLLPGVILVEAVKQIYAGSLIRPPRYRLPAPLFSPS